MSDIFNLDESIGYEMEIAEKTLKRALTRRFHDNGFPITPNQWVVLYRLWEQGGVSQAELSERTFKDHASVTRILDLLQAKGYISRKADDSDRRIFRIHLTQKGKDLRAALPPIVRVHMQTATRGISAKDLSIARRVLNTMWKNCDEAIPTRGSRRREARHEGG